jgi:hypothetical protein
MPVWAMGFVCVEMSASFHYVPHVLCLCSAFEVVWVHTDRVVAFVSYDRGKVSVV